MNVAKSKPQPRLDDELRMKSRDFDRIMREALKTPPPQDEKKKTTKKTRTRKK